MAPALLVCAATLSAEPPNRVPAETLLDRATLKALDEELSGVAAKDHVSRLAQWHRVPASPGFHDAVEYEPVDVKAVSEYVDVLAKAGAVTFQP